MADNARRIPRQASLALEGGRMSIPGAAPSNVHAVHIDNAQRRLTDVRFGDVDKL
jgi:hypothetical protein